LYQQSIQQAFREVSDSLVAYSKDQAARQQQELLTQSAEEASKLSDLRYRGGAASYLEVLDSNTRQYRAGTRTGPGAIERTARLRSDLPGAGRRLGVRFPLGIGEIDFNGYSMCRIALLVRRGCCDARGVVRQSNVSDAFLE
jgi:hypothetical protein